MEIMQLEYERPPVLEKIFIPLFNADIAVQNGNLDEATRILEDVKKESERLAGKNVIAQDKVVLARLMSDIIYGYIRELEKAKSSQITLEQAARFLSELELQAADPEYTRGAIDTLVRFGNLNPEDLTT